MPGYLNRFIDVDFSEYGDGCYVRIHNPKIVPQSMLEPKKRLELDANNKPVDRDASVAASREVLAGLVKDWKIYDATCLEDEQPLLSLPATPEMIAKLPLSVFVQLQKIVNDAIPDPS